MALTYYIDGYNLLHSSARLAKLAGADFEAARNGLVDEVARFCIATGEEVRLIFDGRGKRTGHVPATPGVSGLKVTFTPHDRTADAVIERAVYQASHRGRVVVVTGDRGIRDLCVGLGALVMSPEHFFSTAHAVYQETSAPTLAQQSVQTMGCVEDRLDEVARDRLAALRMRLDS